MMGKVIDNAQWKIKMDRKIYSKKKKNKGEKEGIIYTYNIHIYKYIYLNP